MSTKKKATTEGTRETPRALRSAGFESARTTPMGITEEEQKKRLEAIKARRAKKTSAKKEG